MEGARIQVIDRFVRRAREFVCKLGALLKTFVAAPDPFAIQRERMVREQLVSRGISNPDVLRVMRATPRHLFIQPSCRFMAYGDYPVYIGHSATISQPHVVALMTELLEPTRAQCVLEIGTGSGYQAAILAQLVRWVHTIEIVPELAWAARETLRLLGYTNVTVHEGNGYLGLPEEAPFNGILVTAAPPFVPQSLLDQLASGGRLLLPIGSPWQQELILIEKGIEGRLQSWAVAPVAFVPMVPSHHQ
jgi:protein-L-isoaspartate(D-aspartate) O-methyltransferase